MKDRFCDKPRKGWYCTYAEGHVRQCDEWPEFWMSVMLWFKGR